MTQVAEHALLTGRAALAGDPGAEWPYALFLARRYREAVAQLDALVPGDPVADAVRDLVVAACLAQPPRHLADRLPDDRDSAALVRYLRAETAMTAGLVAEAERLATLALAAVPADRPWHVMSRLVRARSLAFLGRLPESRAEAEAAGRQARDQGWTPPALIADSVLTFVAAHLGDVPAVEAWTEGLRLRIPSATSYGEQMAYLLGALALSGAGRPTAAAELLFGSCGGRGVPDLPLFARAYAVDVMVEGAVATAQVAVAAEYVRLADGLDVTGQPMAAAALDRARARLAVVVGDAAVAAERAEQSGRRAEDVGGALYVVRARLLRAVAERESGDPVAAAEAARIASEVGPDDVRLWAERELAGLGAESRPVPGIGWDQLDERRQLVARLAAQGRRNREIAELMRVSVKTVERDVSEILRLMSATRRVDLVRVVPAAEPVAPGALLALTQRQSEVAERISLGLTNVEIADSLGLTVKSVEKHVSAIFDRLGVDSRTAVAALMRDQPV
ncbi:LuxR C-terminal-related transcriptional regulator [Aeromicrobium sp. Leaf350]|uniref:LuxR C-terminal-related transcriptional regulator n=1 Tax=Aeromicrobium sp. Leaf350 TaxID=2876565 RepID=UPI001E39D28D|nr:LuxR C-terminal-related transcriptional regulator [Aeromicrobium sp. Leaf350]